MSRLAEIEAEEESTRKQLALWEQLAKLDREKKSLRHAQRLDDDDEDSKGNKVKLELLEREDTADGEDGSQEGMQNNNDEARPEPPIPNELQLNQTRPQSMGETCRTEPTAAFHQQHYTRGQPERGDRSYVQDRVGHQQQDTNPQHDFEAGNHQPHMGDFPTPGPLLRTTQQWAQEVQDPDSPSGSMQQNRLARDESVAPNDMITPQASERQAWSPPNYQQHLFQQRLPPGQVPPLQAPHQPQPQQAFEEQQTGGQAVQPQPVRTEGQVGPEPPLAHAATVQTSRHTQYDHHPTLSTLILLPNGQGYRELRCYVCKGNISKTVQFREKAQTHKGKPPKGKTPDSKSDEPRFFSGIRGFQGHIRFCHPSELDENGTITPADIFEKCKHRDLNHQEVIALVHPRRGYKGYKIEAVPGASAHEDSTVKQSRQRGSKNKVGSPSTKAQMAGKSSSKKRNTTLAGGGKQMVKKNSQSEEPGIPVKTKRKRRSEALDLDSRQKQRKRKSYVLKDESEESESDSEDEPLRTVIETRKRRQAIKAGSVRETERDSTMREADAMLAALRGTFGGEVPNQAGSEAGEGESRDED